jgi:hypothetical protein
VALPLYSESSYIVAHVFAEKTQIAFVHLYGKADSPKHKYLQYIDTIEEPSIVVIYK